MKRPIQRGHILDLNRIPPPLPGHRMHFWNIASFLNCLLDFAAMKERAHPYLFRCRAKLKLCSVIFPHKQLFPFSKDLRSYVGTTIKPSNPFFNVYLLATTTAPLCHMCQRALFVVRLVCVVIADLGFGGPRRRKGRKKDR